MADARERQEFRGSPVSKGEESECEEMAHNAWQSKSVDMADGQMTPDGASASTYECDALVDSGQYASDPFLSASKLLLGPQAEFQGLYFPFLHRIA